MEERVSSPSLGVWVGPLLCEPWGLGLLILPPSVAFVLSYPARDKSEESLTPWGQRKKTL
jgi:hypothetical protein